MDKYSVRGCPICEDNVCEVLHSQRFVLPEGHPLARGYDVVCCRGCGFVYADTPVSQRDYDAFYRRCSKYEDDKTSTGGGEAPWDARRLREMAAALAEGVPDRGARILDVGCANGGLLRALGELGYRRLTGLDPSAGCVRNTRRLPGVRAEVGTLADLPEGLGPFDCVVLSHVLEHVQDVRAAVDAVVCLLAEGGCVYVEVPDAARYAECLVAPFQDFNTEHINHFSLACLTNLGRRADLTLARAGTKTLESPPPLPYPAVFAFFRRREPGAPVLPLVPDAGLRGRILDYVRGSTRLLREIDARLRGVIRSGAEVIVWGTGQLALKLLAETALGRARIAAFVDGNPINHGRRLHGRRVLAPTEAAALPHPIIITSVLHQEEIREVIRERLGLPNSIITLVDSPLAVAPSGW
jgi:SAM-dependent methyltransferase